MPDTTVLASFVDENGRVCTGPCGQYKTWDSFYRRNGRTGHHASCKDCFHAYDAVKAEWRKRLRETALAAYGDCCACCEEKEPIFLTIDHINNDGAEHRREIGSVGGRSFYSWLRKNNYPEGFQVLCWNCNSGKHLNGGVCPHELVRS
jgi:hypothetical protein